MVYVGTYALIYLHTILGEGMDSRDGLPRGALPSGILKMRKNVQALKFPALFYGTRNSVTEFIFCFINFIR